MTQKVDNAIIMAAGLSSRFAPLSLKKPKALLRVRGEILIERQIRQLLEAGIPEIYLVVGYKAEQFSYLKDQYPVHLLENKDYLTRNNNGSIYAARDLLANSYICSADNYFAENPFEAEVDEGYYAALYTDGKTEEWCLEPDGEGYIKSVSIGGEKSWYMMGHAFWDEAFSRQYLAILDEIYELDSTRPLLWEAIYIEHLDKLKLKLRKYHDGIIYEFDCLEELAAFDPVYRNLDLTVADPLAQIEKTDKNINDANY